MVFEGLPFGEKIKNWWKIADTSSKFKTWIFLNATSILVFAKIFHSIQIRTSLGKIVSKITR